MTRSRNKGTRPNLVDLGRQGGVPQAHVYPHVQLPPAQVPAHVPIPMGMMHHGMPQAMAPGMIAQQMQASMQIPARMQAPPQNSGGQGPPVTPLIVDSSSAIQIANNNSSMYQERSLMARNDIWHRILILHGARYDKENILKSVLKNVQPADLIPVKYQVVGDDACFIARNCDRALDALCKTSLIVQYTDGTPLILSITLGYASIHDLKINIQPLLLQVLKKRYKPEKKTLNLDEFHRDPDIYHTVYCPLSQSKTMIHVLKLARSALGAFDYLSLQNNELTSVPLASLEVMKFVKHLDLSHNHLLKVQELDQLKTYNITEIWLDGNPLCENYSDPRQYVEAVREYCPKLAKLDGIQINALGLPLNFKTYVKNWKRRKLVEQFVEHFFTAYDQKDRSVMRGLYDRHAWYSMTVGTPTSPSSKKLLETFSSENRNLIIFGKNSQQLLYHGEDKIFKVLKKLPSSQHIIKSFCCDLMVDTNDYVTISVDGLFKLVNVPNQIFSFNRLFVLTPEDDNEYKIVNDQYHVYLPVQAIDYDAYNIESEEMPTYETSCFSPAERENTMLCFQEWTTMKLEYCEKYLKEAEWDRKKALSNFMIDYKNKYVPDEAFP